MRCLAFALLAVVLGAVGCGILPTRDNPAFCCLSAQSCAEANGSITNCDDPDRPFCTDDMVTDAGPKFTCEPDPLMHACSDPSQCPAERPFCVDMKCAQCSQNLDCPVTSPLCEPSTNLCGACEGDPDCTGRTGTPRCNTNGGDCVECLDAGDCSNAAAPACDQDTHACRGCIADAECSSNACDADTGMCAAEADVIYLSPTGSGTACTMAAPCGTFATGLLAVTGSRNIIKAAPGTYTGPITISGMTVTIRGQGATAQPAAVGTDILTVSSSAVATIDGLTLTGAGGTGQPLGVRCTNATLTLRGATVIGNDGGIVISDCEYTLINNVIAGNGELSSTFGGVQIQNIGAAGVHEFAFNTVSGNGGGSNAITGVECASITTPLVFSNDIVYGNTVSGTGTQVGGSPNCGWTYSDVGPDTVAGNGNIDADPQFVDAANSNYHLMSGSPAQNVGDPASMVTRDIDLDLRPQGAGYEMGADEVPE